MTDWEIIHAYTRADAIADGTLRDVTTEARESGFTLPTALTEAVWIDCVAWTDADTERTGWPQDERGRLHDVLWMAFLAVRRARARGYMTTYELYRVPTEGHAVEGEAAKPVTLKIVVGPGDQGEPVLTIMQPEED